MSKQPSMNYPPLDMEAIGARLKMLREERAITVEELRSFLGFTTGRAIYQWERGETLPTLDNCYAVSRYFRISIEEILSVAGREEPVSGAAPDPAGGTTEAETRIQKILAQGDTQFFSKLCDLLQGEEKVSLQDVAERLPTLLEEAVRDFAADHEGRLPTDTGYDVQRLEDYLLLGIHKWLCAGEDNAGAF